MNRLRTRSGRRLAASILVVCVVSWLMPPAVQASMALTRLSDVSALDGSGVSANRDAAESEVPDYLQRMSRSLERLVDARGQAHGMSGGGAADLLRQVLLDGVAAAVSFSGVTGRVTVLHADRHPSQRYVLAETAGLDRSTVVQLLRAGGECADIPASVLIDTLSDSEPQGP